jgi:ATP-binding cassette subfamily C protein LapB
MTPLAMVTGLMTRLQQTASSLKGLNQIMGLPREYGTERQFSVKDSFDPDYTLKNITVKYPGQSAPALDDVSLRIEPGERIGIIGRMGSGKSTLLKLLAKLYEPESGEILLDGLELSQYHPVTLRRQVGYLPQNPSIFHGSLRDNVAFGTPWVSDEEVFAAVQMAGLGTFVNRSPLGMYTPVGEQGSCLSGGQREAIALARCLLNKPKLLLLDEPTANMDVNTEEEVISNLRSYLEEFPDRTLLISTHKLHLLDIVNRVIVVDQGKVVLDGPKTKVMKMLMRENVTRVVRKGAVSVEGRS